MSMTPRQTPDAVREALEPLRALLAASNAPWPSTPWKVIPSDGKPIIASDRGGNLFRGYIATWQEADLIVGIVNALPAILAALDSRAGDAGEGWKLVPVEPTREMIRAGMISRFNLAEQAARIWRDMLAATPAPAVDAGEECGYCGRKVCRCDAIDLCQAPGCDNPTDNGICDACDQWVSDEAGSLAADQGEPVAWRVDDLTSKGEECGSFTFYADRGRAEYHAEKNGHRNTRITPLYAATPAPAVDAPTERQAAFAKLTAMDDDGFPDEPLPISPNAVDAVPAGEDRLHECATLLVNVLAADPGPKAAAAFAAARKWWDEYDAALSHGEGRE